MTDLLLPTLSPCPRKKGWLVIYEDDDQWYEVETSLPVKPGITIRCTNTVYEHPHCSHPSGDGRMLVYLHIESYPVWLKKPEIISDTYRVIPVAILPPSWFMGEDREVCFATGIRVNALNLV